MRFDKGSEAIINLCSGRESTIRTPPSPTPPDRAAAGGHCGDCPDPESSSFSYENHLVFETASGTVAMRTLPTDARSSGTPANQGGFGETQGFGPINAVESGQTKVQRRTRDAFYAVLEGRAARI